MTKKTTRLKLLYQLPFSIVLGFLFSFIGFPAKVVAVASMLTTYPVIGGNGWYVSFLGQNIFSYGIGEFVNPLNFYVAWAINLVVAFIVVFAVGKLYYRFKK